MAVKGKVLTTKGSVYFRILRYLGPYRRTFVFAMICMIIFGATDGAVPFFIRYILDEVFSGKNTQFLYLLPGVLIIFAVIRGAADFGQSFLMAKVGHTIVRDLRTDVDRAILRLEPAYFIATASGNLLARITSDVLLVKTLLTESLAAIIRDSIRVVVLLAAAVYLDPLLAAIAFIVFPIGVVPVYRFGRRMRKLSKRAQESIGSLSSLMHESILGNRVVKIFGREEDEARKFARENERVNQTLIKSEKVRAATGPINELLATLVISGVILYGGYSVVNDLRSQGEFLAFLASVFLLYDPFKKLSRVNNVVQQGIAGAERIFEILDRKPSVTDPENPETLPQSNEIVFEQVSFAYPNSEQQALSSISLRIPEGKKFAFVGFSGAGKSTLVDLLPRFIDPEIGRVLIGNVDIRKVRLDDLRGRIAMVGQHTFLFNDTIFKNIAYGSETAGSEEVMRAAKAAYAYDFIMQLPAGFDTIIGEDGYTLSGGERQRIAIARAILKDAPILVLDEATASLDNRSEREVQAALEALERNRTSLIIAHRLSTIREADCIVVMREGKVAEMGTHKELLGRGGEYSRLHALQFGREKEGPLLPEAVVI
jgi:subfamily B ATP-binding cassette protein MsbA